ncbi:MAG: hypothetical protein OHK0012_22360 [Synechococcales cyanobacterium]
MLQIKSYLQNKEFNLVPLEEIMEESELNISEISYQDLQESTNLGLSWYLSIPGSIDLVVNNKLILNKYMVTDDLLLEWINLGRINDVNLQCNISNDPLIFKGWEQDVLLEFEFKIDNNNRNMLSFIYKNIHVHGEEACDRISFSRSIILGQKSFLEKIKSLILESDQLIDPILRKIDLTLNILDLEEAV